MTHKTRHTLTLAVLLALIISIAPAGIAQNDLSSPAEAHCTGYGITPILAATIYVEAWNTGDTNCLVGLLTGNHITQTLIFGEVTGAEALDALIANTRTAIPDYTFTVDDISDFDDQIYVEGTITGTHSGPLMLNENLPIIPTGNGINVRAMLIATMAEGKISRVEWHDDTFAMMTQMGAAKSPVDVLKERRNTEVIQIWVDTLLKGDDSEATRDLWISSYQPTFIRYTPNDRQEQEHDVAHYWQLFDEIRTAFPEREVNVISITATGDYVTLVYEFNGLFAADIHSPNRDTGGIVKATGEEYGWDGAFVFRLEDGLIAEEWWYWDNELFAKVDYGYAD